eukprot:jgi/Botrbrau1/11959/Bobra.341_1s0024.1
MSLSRLRRSKISVSKKVHCCHVLVGASSLWWSDGIGLLGGGGGSATSWWQWRPGGTPPEAAVCALVAGSAATACSDVVVDSIVVERSRDAPQSVAGSLQSLCWGASAVGGIASAYFSGSLVGDWGPRPVFALTAIFPLVVCLSAILISEAPSGSNPSKIKNDAELQRPDSPQMSPRNVPLRECFGRLAAQARSLWSAVSRPTILLPAGFVFLWQATPSADTAMFYFQTNELGFTPEFMGRVRLVGALASLAGVAVYNTWLKDVPLRKMFLWTAVLGTALGLTQLLLITGYNKQLGLSNELFVLGDSLVLTVLGQVSFMPILVLAARICPEGVEATLFATLMSILNAGGFTGSFLGSGLTMLFGVTATNFERLRRSSRCAPSPRCCRCPSWA